MTGETTFRPAQYEREQLSLYLQDTLNTVETLKESVKFMEEEREQMKGKLQSVESECNESNDKVKDLDKVIQGIKEELKENEQKLEGVNTQVSDLSGELDNTRKSLEEFKLQNYNLSIERDGLVEKKISDQEALAVKENELEALSEEIEELKEGLATANAIVNAHVSSLDGLLHDYEEEKEERQRLENKLAESTSDLTSQLEQMTMLHTVSEEKNKDLNEANAQLQDNIVKLGQLKEELQKDMCDLEKEVQHQKKKNTMMDADLKTFKEEHLGTKNKEIMEAMNLIRELKQQIEYQREEVKTLRIKHSSKSKVFADQSQEVHELKDRLSLLEDKNDKHDEVLKEAVSRAGKVLKQAHCRNNAPISITRVKSCPDLDQPFPRGPTIEPNQKRRVKNCWTSSVSVASSQPKEERPRSAAPATPTNICEAFSDNGDVTLCTRDREKVLIMRDQEKVQVKSLRVPRDIIEHTRPFSPSCTCEACRKLTSEHPSARTVKNSHNNTKDGIVVPMRVGDRVRCKTKRPGYRQARMSEGLVEYIGKRLGHGPRIFVGINLGMATGDTDGYMEGERLFRVAPKHGVVVPLEDVISYYSLKSQSFVPLYLPSAPYIAPHDGPRAKKTKKKKRPNSANSSIASSIDDRFVRSPYLQSLISLDPNTVEFKMLNKSFNSIMINKPRISRPIPRERMRHRSVI